MLRGGVKVGNARAGLQFAKNALGLILRWEGPCKGLRRAPQAMAPQSRRRRTSA